MQKRWIDFLVRQPVLLKFFDFLSTAIRIKLRMVPPLCFVSLREHLTFFSIAGVTQLLQAQGLHVLSARVHATGHIGVVAVKPTPP